MSLYNGVRGPIWASDASGEWRFERIATEPMEGWGTMGMAMDGAGALHVTYLPHFEELGTTPGLDYRTNASGAWAGLSLGHLSRREERLSSAEEIGVDSRGVVRVLFTASGSLYYASNADGVDRDCDGEDLPSGYEPSD